MSSYASIDTHRSMIFDQRRNRAYEKALRSVVAPGSRVLDLGAGLGIHGMLAAKLGAERVFLVDPSPVVLQAESLARENGIAHAISVIRGRVEDIELPERVDVIVSVFTGNFLLDEDLLPSLFQARDRFLAPGGRMVPDRGRMKAALVSAGSFHERHVTRWSQPALGLDFQSLKGMAANTVYFDTAANIGAELLSDPAGLVDLDFASAGVAECRSRVRMSVTRPGACHGVLGWFDLHLGDDWLSTGPESEAMHWSLAFLPLDPPLELKPGDSVEFELDRPEFGQWTWSVSSGGQRQRHSSFRSNLIDLDLLKKQAPARAPGLSPEGELARFVLVSLSEGHSVAEIVSRARTRFPESAERDRRLEERIRSVIARWGGDAS